MKNALLPKHNALRRPVLFCSQLVLLTYTGYLQAQSMDDITVTATPLQGKLSREISPVSVLRANELNAQRELTLGDTLQRLPGVSASGFGPNASRPIIRGLGDDRIRMLSNGSAVLDASSASPDHAVALSPLTAKRIEVLRGPSALRYGGNAIGGAVNVVDDRLPLQAPVGLEVDALLQGQTPFRDDVQAGRVGVANERWALTVDGFHQSRADVRVPGFLRSDRERSSANPRFALPENGVEPRGRLINSSSRSDGGSIGAAIRGKQGAFGVSLQTLNNNYGIGLFSEPDGRIDMMQDRFAWQGQLNLQGGWLTGLTASGSQGRYKHSEIEEGIAETTFRNRGNDSRLEAQNRGLLAKFLPASFVQDNRGVIGFHAQQFRFDAKNAEGANTFLPNTRTEAHALYWVEGVSFKRSELNLGIRHERNKVRADDSVAALGCAGAAERDFGLNSGSLGVRVPVPAGWALTGQLSHTERAPTYQELFACGEHAATFANEYGDARLDKEKANGLELGADWRSSTAFFKINAYQQQFSRYIGLLLDRNSLAEPGSDVDLTGRGNRGADDRGRFFGDFLFSPTRARFRGFEASWQWTPAMEKLMPMWSQSQLRPRFELRADRVEATDLVTGRPLPRISPARLGVMAELSNDRHVLRFDLTRSFRQGRVDLDESPTSGYNLVSFYAAKRYRWAGQSSAELFLRGNNLLNVEARNHVSFLKDALPLPGRSLLIGARLTM